MKKYRILLSLLLAVLMLGCTFNVFAAEIDNSNDDYLYEEEAEETMSLPENTVIVISDTATEQEKYAASALKEYIDKVEGSDIKIITDIEEQTSFEIAVGNTDRYIADFYDINDGGYVIKSTQNGVAVAGLGTRGTVYAAYRFLEEFGGYHCYTSSLGYNADFVAFELPLIIDIKNNGYFEYTDTDWRSPRDTTYSLANGLNGGANRTIAEEQGGTVDYISNFCHTLTTEFCAADKYFEEHPEYFALRDGERCSEQLCLTNEDVIKTVTDEVLSLIKEKRNPEAALQIVSLTQNDNSSYCECENCRKIDDENGAHSGTMITFVNRVAEAVKNAGYDNIAIDTFAYRYTRSAPSNVVPLDNVIVRLCTIECCFSHSLDNANCPLNVALCEDLEAWGEICDRIYVWDYTTNYCNTAGLFPDFGVLQSNMQFFYFNGVKGVYEEGNYYIDECDAEFGELRAYLLSRLMQNPFCDYYEEMNSFLKAYYGGAWQEIRNFIDLITKKANNTHVEIYTTMEKTLQLSKKEILKCDTYWETAKKYYEDLDNTDCDAYKNILRSELSYRFWKLSQSFASVTQIKDKISLYNDLVSMGITKMHEGEGDMSVSPIYFLSRAEDWGADDNNGNAPLFNLIAYVIYAIALIFAAIIFIKALKYKKYLFCVVLPLYIAFLKVFRENRLLYIDWDDIAEYAIMTAIAGTMFILLVVLYGLTDKKPGIKMLIKYAAAGLLIFIVPYELSLTLVNNVMYGGGANSLACSVMALVMSVVISVISVLMCRKLKRTDK